MVDLSDGSADHKTVKNDHVAQDDNQRSRVLFLITIDQLKVYIYFCFRDAIFFFPLKITSVIVVLADKFFFTLNIHFYSPKNMR